MRVVNREVGAISFFLFFPGCEPAQRNGVERSRARQRQVQRPPARSACFTRAAPGSSS